ncbi:MULTISPECIES: arabinosyltransferase domain-containing protein [Lawsonella]|nr:MULTISPECIES: arabinosyltransferase domain-containing protein [Lawsonella]
MTTSPHQSTNPTSMTTDATSTSQPALDTHESSHDNTRRDTHKGARGNMHGKRVAILATITGIIGFLLAIASAVLPVQQSVATIDWNQNTQPAGITSPLVSYIPQNLVVTLPCGSVTNAPQNTLLFSTVPAKSANAGSEGMQIRRAPDGTGTDTLSITSKSHLLFAIPVSELEKQPADCRITTTVRADAGPSDPSVFVTATATTFAMSTADSDNPKTDSPISGELATDSTTRPQVVGFFTTLPHGTRIPGLTAHMVVDTRFSTSPTPLKTTLMVLGIVASLASLVMLWRIDRMSWRYRRDSHTTDADSADVASVSKPGVGVWVTDAVVTILLLVWHFFGANTSDDGYLLNMARVADHAGYISNYYRWLGSPESPIGWYYSILQALTRISTASPFIRIPTLLAGIISWFIISHSLIPRLGAAFRTNTIAYWTAGMFYLACWMPLDNGLRPEPIEAVLFIACWALVERAIANGTLLPGAFAILAAAFAIGAGPTGIMCLAILFAGFRSYWQNIRMGVYTLRTAGEGSEGSKGAGKGAHKGASKGLAIVSIIFPILATGFLILYTVFADQTLGAMREAVRVRTEIGPNLGWFEDKARWIALFGISPDGSVTRRFPIFMMLMILGIMVFIIARRKPIAGLSTPVLTRVAGISIGSLLLLTLTPTKWTHHFGTFTGIIAVVGAIGAVLMTNRGIAVTRNRWLAAATTVAVTALAFTANNDWWYVSQFGINTTHDEQNFPTFCGKAISTWFLGLALLFLLVAAILHFFPSIDHKLSTTSKPAIRKTTNWLASKPIVLAVLSTFVVAFSLASFLGAYISRRPAYTVGSANMEALRGRPCSLADQVLVEPDPGRWILHPVDGGSLANALAGTVRNGFQEGGLPDSIDDNQTELNTGDAVETPDRQNHKIPPFGLPLDVPILGTYRPDNQVSAHLVTSWYRLPAQRDDSPLLVLTIAGTLKDTAVHVEWTTDDLTAPNASTSGTGAPSTDAPGTGTYRVAGRLVPMDPGPTPSWRNLRLRRPHDIPANATAIRISVDDTSLDTDKWIAVTPPRAPQLRTLNEVVGSTDPVLIDWSVGLAFPCQRPYHHRNGIAEQPKWRILPNGRNVESANSWEDTFGGGPLGWTDLLYYAENVPTYLNHDWLQDWGALQRFIPRDPAATPAAVTVTEKKVSGFYTPGTMRDTPPAPKRH